MALVQDVETPAVLIDLDRLERNVARMAEAARGAGVRLRPHAKTHKVPEVGRLQIAAGAVGLTLAKPGEVEVFCAAGFEDIFIAYPTVGADKARRLLALPERLRLRVGADSVEGARTLGEVFHRGGRRLDILLKVDVGSRRVGVRPEDALETARRLADLPGLRLRGVFTHSGAGYHEPTPAGVAEAGRHEGGTMVAVAEALRHAGLPIEEVSVGSTPTGLSSMAVAGVTECRPGTYVYQDASQVSLGTCTLDDCALTVLATVVSTPAPDRAVVDAGSKSLSSDPLRPTAGGHGWILGRRSRVQRLSEEHGVIEVVAGESFRIGERVRVLPNHACVVSNLFDRVLAVRGDRVEAEWPVAARGRVS
jgi:D-serine deaminase-like pyridoxal phosphate-dependent protein